jgi:hypothetical protein
MMSMSLSFAKPSFSRSVRSVQVSALPSTDKTIFQYCKDHRTYPSLEEVRDIFEICKGVKTHQHREAIYIMNNMDCDMVETYLAVVEYLERCYKRPSHIKRIITRVKKSKKI